MPEPTITCPTCRAEIKLTESLAAPLIEATRRDFEKRLSQQNAEMAKREQLMKDREGALAKEKESVDQQVLEKLKTERARIAAEESKKARVALGNDLEARVRELAELQELLKARDEKLAEAQKAQAELIRARREMEEQKRELELTIETRVQQSLGKVQEAARKEAEEENRKARQALGNDLETRVRELAELQELLKARDEKLAEAQKAQVELIRTRREMEEQKRELELTIETRVQESLGKVQESARKEAEEKLQLKVMEKEEMISSLGRKVEELQRKIEQGSQQLQGEVQELLLETLLGGKFPHDRIEPVPKGEHGGDIVQRVVLPTGQGCGSILWESKRTKNWIDGWLPKLREDQRAAKAEIAVLVSPNLPKGVETFDQVDGIWVTHPRAVLPVALSLRHMLIEVSCARQASEGQQTKMELIYQYLTGPKFRLRIQAIVEAFTDMEEDLQKEKKAITKQWAKREEQIYRAMQATAGMHGELQGIAGKSLAEIDGLDFKMLEITPAS